MIFSSSGKENLSGAKY